MGQIYLNGEPYGDLPSIPTARPFAQTGTRIFDNGALQETIDRLEQAARRVVRYHGAINTRARRFIKKPLAMDRLYPDLSLASGKKMVAVAAHLIDREETTPRRWVGFGGENDLINAHAVMLLGRALRLAERRAS